MIPRRRKGKRHAKADEAQRMIQRLFNRIPPDEVSEQLDGNDPVWLDISAAVFAWHVIHWARFGKPRMVTGDLLELERSKQTLAAIAQYAYALGQERGREVHVARLAEEGLLRD